MTPTYETVSKAEDMYECYDEAMSSIRSAIETLKAANDGTAAGFAEALEDILSEIKSDNEQYDAILCEDDRLEKEQMLRDYWRAVI